LARKRSAPPKGGRLHYFELFASLLMMLLEANGTLLVVFLSAGVSLAALAFFILFFAYVILYVAKGRGGAGKGSAILHIVFAGMAASFALSLCADPVLLLGEVARAVVTLYNPLLYLVLFLPLFFLTLFAAYFARVKRDYRAAAVLFAVVLLIMVLYYASHFLFKGYNLDDEEVLGYEGVGIALSGANPYAVSVSPTLYAYAVGSGVPVTITTENKIIGVMDYPALFFLSLAPFCFASGSGVAGLGTTDLPLQAVAFIFALLVVFGMVINKEDLLRPRYLLLASFIFPLAYMSSVTTYLMLALVILAYAKIDSKHVWVVLGLCLAVQEELWLPVLFLLAYSLNRHGLRRGARNVAGAAAVFLAVNAYFIAIGPSAFLGAVFFPLSSTILPSSPSPFGLLLLKGYPILLSAYSQVFELTAVLLVLAFLYADRKELVPVFSLAVLLIIPHVILPYYALFLFFIMVAVCLGEKKAKEGAVTRFVRERKLVFAAAALAVMACMAVVVVSSHAAWERGFGIGVVNQSLAQNASSNTTVYHATVVYGNLTNRTVYLAVVAHGGIRVGWMGLLNQTILPSEEPCSGSYECYVNTNRIVLPANRTSYEITANLPWMNGTWPIDYASAALYNGEYFYIGNGTSYPGR